VLISRARQRLAEEAMWLTRTFVIVGAAALLLFFGWPWLHNFSVDGEIQITAGTFNAQVPAILGIFASLGLAAMLIAVKR
jgi:hypothetical protein